MTGSLLHVRADCDMYREPDNPSETLLLTGCSNLNCLLLGCLVSTGQRHVTSQAIRQLRWLLELCSVLTGRVWLACRAFVLAYSTIMLNTDAHNPRLTGQARMTKVQFIEGNRRTPDLAPLSEAFMSQLYDEIVVNEIKMDSTADDLVAAQAEEKKIQQLGGNGRRRSLSDMFDIAPVVTVEEQKKAFEDLGQKMYDVQQRGIKGAPKKVQIGVTGMGITIFDLKGKPVQNILLMSMQQWTTDDKGVEITLKGCDSRLNFWPVFETKNEIIHLGWRFC